MAINLDERYPGRANPKSLSYPQGSFKNRTSPTSKDGTYLEQDWANDWAGFFQRMMLVAGMSPNGSVDTAESSQYFDALSKVISDATPDASTTKKGLVELATAAEAQAITDDSKALTPKKLGDAMNAHVLGMGQTWQDVTSQRVSGTTYTNTTGRTIAVSVDGIPKGADNYAYVFSFSVNGVTVASGRVTGLNKDDYPSLFAIVPAGATYTAKSTSHVTNGISRWMELR